MNPGEAGKVFAEFLWTLRLLATQALDFVQQPGLGLWIRQRRKALKLFLQSCALAFSF